MKKSRYTDEQIIGFLKQVESAVAVKELGRKHGFSDAAFHKWRAKFCGTDVSEAHRLRELEGENSKLKKPSRSRWSSHASWRTCSARLRSSISRSCHSGHADHSRSRDCFELNGWPTGWFKMRWGRVGLRSVSANSGIAR